MGRPVGSVNREKPFTDMLRVALLSGGGRRLRIIADKLLDKAEQGDLRQSLQGEALWPTLHRRGSHKSLAPSRGPSGQCTQGQCPLTQL